MGDQIPFKRIGTGVGVVRAHYLRNVGELNISPADSPLHSQPPKPRSLRLLQEVDTPLHQAQPLE